MCVVDGLSWPSHRAITAMSTPDCNRCMAVVCRKVCGEIDRAFSWGFIWAATSTASASRCVTEGRASVVI